MPRHATYEEVAEMISAHQKSAHDEHERELRSTNPRRNLLHNLCILGTYPFAAIAIYVLITLRSKDHSSPFVAIVVVGLVGSLLGRVVFGLARKRRLSRRTIGADRGARFLDQST